MLDDHTPCGFWCFATLAADVSWRRRRTWYRGLERQLLSEGFVTGLHRSVLVALDRCPGGQRRYRYRLVQLLLQDPILVVAQVGDLLPISEVDAGDASGTFGWKATGLPHGSSTAFARATLHSIHRGVTRASRSAARCNAGRRIRKSLPARAAPPAPQHAVLEALRL